MMDRNWRYHIADTSYTLTVVVDTFWRKKHQQCVLHVLLCKILILLLGRIKYIISKTEHFFFLTLKVIAFTNDLIIDKHIVTSRLRILSVGVSKQSSLCNSEMGIYRVYSWAASTNDTVSVGSHGTRTSHLGQTLPVYPFPISFPSSSRLN